MELLRKRQKNTAPLAAAKPPAPAGVDPGARDVRDRLQASGASSELIAWVLRRTIERGGRGAYAVDAAARTIGETFPIRRSPKRGTGPHLFAFLGPTGAGKTTALAKLGRRMSDAGRKVVFASLDPVGSTALEKVGGIDADVDRAEIPLVSLRGVGDLRRLVRESADKDAILVDTPGFPPREARHMGKIGRELARLAEPDAFDLYLVLPAGASRESLSETVAGFRRAAPTAAVITKLDETSRPAPVLETALAAELPIALLCDGQDVRSHLFRPSPDRLADLLLRGRLS